MRQKHAPSAYQMAGYMLKVTVVILVIIFIVWAAKSMGPLNSLVF